MPQCQGSDLEVGAFAVHIPTRLPAIIEIEEGGAAVVLATDATVAEWRKSASILRGSDHRLPEHVWRWHLHVAGEMLALAEEFHVPDDAKLWPALEQHLSR